MQVRKASLQFASRILVFVAISCVAFCTFRARVRHADVHEIAFDAWAAARVDLRADVRDNDEKAVAALDERYQDAVKKNDVATMESILALDFVLVTGRGRMQTRADLIKESAGGTIKYEHQEDTNRTVRVWGDTAVVTALLWGKGTENGKGFDYKLWFSDVYVHTPAGWRYASGQAAQPLVPPS
jgi:ketosteroid isomerase-like protein